MATSLKTLLNTVCAEVNIAQPTSFIGNAAQDPTQLVALAIAAGKELTAKYDWPFLAKEMRFTYQWSIPTDCIVTSGSATVVSTQGPTFLNAATEPMYGGSVNDPTEWTVSGTGIPQDTVITSIGGASFVMSQAATASSTGSQSLTLSQTKYLLPSDFERWIDRTMWDKSKHWEMMGPSDPQQWQWLKSGYISTGPRIRFRKLGNYMQMWPLLSTSEYLGFEYISNLWAAPSTGGVNSWTQSQFLADTDICAFDDRLFITLVKLKYLASKGLATAAIAEEMNNLFSLRTAQIRGAPILSMAPRLTEVLIGVQNIPDSGYGH